jgi:aspartate/methionine/tyrosine aminotransferase
MAAPDSPRIREALRPFGTSIFTEMTALAVRTGAVNLGQGFPDFDAPDFVKEAAVRAIRDGQNQYARPYGIPALAGAIAAHQERLHGLRYDPLDEVTVVAGATEALHATIMGLLEPGDEAILFEPYYDAYRPDLAMAGASWSTVRLEPPGFAFDPRALEASSIARTTLPGRSSRSPSSRRSPSSAAAATSSRSRTRSTSTWSSTARTSRSPRFRG